MERLLEWLEQSNSGIIISANQQDDLRARIDAELRRPAAIVSIPFVEIMGPDPAPEQIIMKYALIPGTPAAKAAIEAYNDAREAIRSRLEASLPKWQKPERTA